MSHLPKNLTPLQSPHYSNAFAAAAGVYAAGVVVQLVTGRAISEPSWPANFVMLAVFVVVLIAAQVFAGRTDFIRWLRSVPVAISAITLVLAQAVFMGSIRQAPGAGIFGDIMHSWPFALTMMFFLVNLGLATISRVVPFKKENIGFLLNHLGLWIALAAGMLGSGDFTRLTMNLTEGTAEWRAIDNSHGDHSHIANMTFALELKKFEMEVFPAKLALLDTATSKIDISAKRAPLEIPNAGARFQLGDWQIEVHDNFSEAAFFGGAYHAMPGEIGTVPAARVTATKTSDAKVVTGWVSSGNFANAPAILELGDGTALIMPAPEPKRYASRVEVFTDAKEQFLATIEVNKPLSLRGWKIYQVSYDERRGRWSQTSVVELIRDPWLPGVYTGIYMMIAGAFFIMAKMRKAKT